MTNASNEETPKRTRRAAKTAASEAATEAPPPETSEPALEEVSSEPAAAAVTWNDVVKASAERDASEWEWEEAEEVIPVKLGSADKARLLDENAIDQKAKDEVDAKIDALKDQIKTLKAEADVILSRTEERNRACGAGVEQRRDTWKIGTCFAVNTVRYVDRETGQVMHERAIEDHERQVALPLVSPEATAKAAQLSLGDADPSDLTDPDALLRAAQEGEDTAIAGEDDGDLGEEDDGDDEDSDL